MQRLHGVDSVGVFEFDDRHFAESASADDLQRLKVFLPKAKLFDLVEDRLGVLQKVGDRLLSSARGRRRMDQNNRRGRGGG